MAKMLSKFKVFHPKQLLLLYFLLMFLGLMWILFNVGSFCPKDDDPRVFPHAGFNTEQTFRERDKELKIKQQELDERERNLNGVIKELKYLFPNKVEEILARTEDDIPVIYAVTPTYARPEQKAELTRLAQTFLHVKNFHWIIVEDSDAKTKLVTNFLARSGLRYTHLNVGTPPEYKLQDEDPHWSKPRGVLQRNAAIKWLRDTVNPQREGVVYFADDDNTYDLRLFDEMRYTKHVSVWPVGLVGKLRFERPICKDDKVVGWHTFWMPERPFPMDMAGFAIRLGLFFTYPEVKFKLRVKNSYQESELLRGLTTVDELEPKANNCSEVLVWHTRTENSVLKNEEKLKKKGLPESDPNIEV